MKFSRAGMSDHQLDATNLLCPLPVIRTQDYIAKLDSGDQLTVFCTDPGALHDIPAWCRINGHEVIQSHCIDHQQIFTIEVHK